MIEIKLQTVSIYQTVELLLLEFFVLYLKIVCDY